MLTVHLLREIRKGGFLLVLIIFLGLVLRLVHINAPLADDELVTTSIWGQMPFWIIPENYQYPNNHIFLTLILHVILKVFGVNHFFLRLPVLLSGILSLLLGYASTRKITKNFPVALGVALILAISSNHIYYSTNARGYLLIVLFAQLVFHWILLVFHEANSGAWARPRTPISMGNLFFLGMFCLLGTWTIPTFFMFEGSLLIFFLILLIWKNEENQNILRSPYYQVILVLVLSILGFCIQYFILIPGELLKISMSRAPVTLPADFFSGIINQIIHPFEPVWFFMVLMFLAGLAVLYRSQKFIFLLIVSATILPPAVIFVFNLVGILKNLPLPRVFLYLQPFFYMCVFIGLYEIISNSVQFLRNRSPHRIISLPIINIIFLAAFLPAGFLASQDLSRNVFPERTGREPFHKIHRFIKNSGPHDLFLASNQIHVEFFLYGAMEMLRRVESIIDSGKLENIFFIGSSINGNQDIELFREGDRKFYLIKNYHTLGEKKQFVPFKVPEAMLQEGMRTGNLVLYKIKRKLIKKISALNTVEDLNRWELFGDPLRVDVGQIPTKTGNRLGIRYSKDFKMFSRQTEPIEPDAPALALKFLVTSKMEDPNVFYLNTANEADNRKYHPSWLANVWTMDHPYGTRIYNRIWRPWIFISKSTQPPEVIHAQKTKSGSTNYIWGLQSYRIELPNQDIQTKDAG